jgi:Leucine-rich repeat (LRR) protein
MHLGTQGCKHIVNINASNNQIRYISCRIKDCINLQSLKLSGNMLSSRDFLPVEFISS